MHFINSQLFDIEKYQAATLSKEYEELEYDFDTVNFMNRLIKS